MSTNVPTGDYHKMMRHKTIVILGETGVGKSSLINNVSLILQFPTLDEAIAGAKDFTPPIPVRGEFKGVDISEGLDPNERNDEGQSRTLMPKVYRVQSSSYVFDIIDTPGISDSGGLEMDRLHVENITACLRQFKEIHAILIAVNSSHNTLTNSLKSTLNELLSCLGKTAAKLICFVVTRVSEAMEMSDARGAIKAYINSLKNNPGIVIERSNMFGFEASSFRYFMALKKGLIEPDDIDKGHNDRVYANNSLELLRLFKEVHNCSEPYKVMNARTLILAKQIQPKLSNLMSVLNEVDPGTLNEMKELEAKLLEWREKELSTRKQKSNETMQRIKNFFGTIPTAIGTLGGGGITLGTGMSFLTKKETVRGAAEVTGTLATINPAIVWCFVGGFGTAALLVGGAYLFTRSYSNTDGSELEQLDEVIQREVDGIREQTRNKMSKFEKFKAEQTILCNLLQDINGYLEKHAIAMSDKFKHVSIKHRPSGDSSGQSSIRNQVNINAVDVLSDMATPSTSSSCYDILSPEILCGRLHAMTKLEYFGEDITKLLSEWNQLKNTELTVVDIVLQANNWFIQEILSNYN